ncbi:DUF1254 domain-containing protein [Phenylobacterium terrae]|uniref:DUF1254 domain-containing protein n=1 Tax=Phenylobacterium terrae TaxID=2665495 RepID=A0ABW4N8G5_9CAUL
MIWRSDRRRLLLSGVAALAGPWTARAAPAGLQAAARDAWIYALAPIEFGGAFQRARTGPGLNTISHVPFLADHTSRTVTTPNNDTLYSSARLDLSDGPVTITLPPAKDRYLSVALLDAYTNNFAILGTRTTPAGGPVRIMGPGHAPEPGAVVAPTPYVWALGRTLVDGPHDLGAALAFARRIEVSGPRRPPPPEVAPRDAPWADYFMSADRLMRLNPPPAADRPFLAQLGPLSLGGGFDPSRFSPADAARIEAGVAEAKALVRRRVNDGMLADGWFYPKPGRGDFGRDYLYRAAVALGGLATLPRQEAMYMRAAGDGLGVFPAGQKLRLSFPPGGEPPASAFWSLSLYEATPEGQFYFAENPLRRYAIGDRTPGLMRAGDGQLDIWISHQDPGPARRANWLPAPNAPFALVLRAYLPGPDLLEGRYRLPPLTRTG